MTAQGTQLVETTLELTNERLRLALVSSKTMAWDWDINSGREHLFGDLRTILGIDADGYDAHIDEVRRSIHPDDIDAATNAMVQARDSRKPYAAEFRVVWPDGTVKWVKSTGQFYYSADGQPQRMLGIATDITERKCAEDALRQSDERYRRIVEATTEGISVADSNFCITFVNRRMAEMLGYEPCEMIGRSVLDFVFPEDLEQKREVFARRRAGVRERYDDRFRHKDGSEVAVQIGSTPIFNGSGEFAGALVMISDISERKRAEQSLRQREEELLEAQRVAHVGSWVWDPKTDNIRWSQESYRIAGRDPHLPPVNFRALRQFCTPETWEPLQRAVEEALKSGTPYELDLELVRQDGTKKWLRTRGEAQRDATGSIAMLRGTIQDITDRKDAEEALRESEARFRNVFQDAGVGMIIASLDGRFLAVNRTFCEYLGYTEEELLHKTVQDVTQPEDWPSFAVRLEEAVATGTSFHRFEKRCRHKDGYTVYTESSALLIQSPSGKPQYFVGEAVNITDRKMAEQCLAEANRKLIDAQEEERARIARDLHDDINQRLALLAVGIEQLRQGSPESRELAGRVGELLRQTDEISADIQSISHQLHPSKLEYLGIVSAIKSFCKESGERQKIDIRFSNENIPATVPREASICLFRVLQEALRNAMKHSGARRFEVCLQGTPGGIRLRVSDSGVGLDAENGNSPRGLGLISMRERVRLVQGTLSIGKTPGGGTTVDAFVPIAGANESSTPLLANQPAHA